MSDETAGRPLARISLTEQAYAWFHRLLGAYCLLFGLTYWVRLVGYYEGPLWRFDLMPAPWQVASLVLAVLFPFAASGLWMVASWGPVIWFICAATEATMYLGFPDIFGHRTGVVVSHALTLAVFAAFRLALFVEARRRGDDR